MTLHINWTKCLHQYVISHLIQVNEQGQQWNYMKNHNSFYHYSNDHYVINQDLVMTLRNTQPL